MEQILYLVIPCYNEEEVLPETSKRLKDKTTLGILILIISFLMLMYTLIQYFLNNVVTGWASTMISIWFLGGLNLFAIGVIGEYLSKIYLEVKNRPRYIIETYLNNPVNEYEEKK